MRTLNEYYNDFVSSADSGSLYSCYVKEHDGYSAIVETDGRRFALGINMSETVGLTLVVSEGSEVAVFSQIFLDEEDEFMLEFIYNHLAA